MELTLQILLGIVSLICLSGGINLLLKGANYFLPENTPPQPTLDNVVRFLSGVYFSLGFLVAWAAFHIQQETDIIYFIGIVVIFAGLGRLYSRFKVGFASKYLSTIMIVEIILGIAIILLQYFR